MALKVNSDTELQTPCTDIELNAYTVPPVTDRWSLPFTVSLWSSIYTSMQQALKLLLVVAAGSLWLCEGQQGIWRSV